jgi:hypothetical protein
VPITRNYRVGLAGGRKAVLRTSESVASGALAGVAALALGAAGAGSTSSSGTDGVTYALSSLTEYEAVIVGDFPSTHGLHVDHTHPPRWFGAADIVAVQDGAWDSNATWDLGRPPAAGEIVHVPTKLTIQTGGNRKLVTQLLAVNTGGELVADFSAVTDTLEIVGADVAIDTVADYAQFGNGLLVLDTGKITLKGEPKTPWGRLAAEVVAGATTITLASAPTNWQPGDRIVLQDSRQARWSLYDTFEPGHFDNHQFEERVVDSVVGAVVTVTAAFTYAHGGAKDKDGTVTYYPAAMNLTRNVKVYSETPSGARWHLLSHGRCTVDVRHCEIRDTGRSKQAAWNNFSGTTAGSNQQGRYGGWHFHHTIGPAGLDSGTPQFRFEGNACWNQTSTARANVPRWGITVHGSHYGLVKDNVLFNWRGAGFVQEDGSERENTVQGNCVFLCPEEGTGENSRGSNDIGHGGQGFWGMSGESRWLSNFAAGCGTGFAVVPYMHPDSTTARIPSAKGKDPYSGTAADYTVIDVQHRPVLEFDGNEVAAHVDIGLTLWKVGSTGFATYSDQAESLILNHKAWHLGHSQFYNYMTRNVTFRNLVARNDFAKLRAGQGGGTCFFTSDYVQEDLLIDQSDIQGFMKGWLVNFGNVQACTATLWCNHSDIIVKPTWGSGTTAENIPPRALTFTDCTFPDPTCSYFENYDVLAREPFVMDGRIPAESVNLIHDDVTQSINHNGTANDYRLLYLEQLGSAVLEQTQTSGITTVLGSPSAGKTNTQNLADHGVCHSNYIPSAPATHADVYGRVEAI